MSSWYISIIKFLPGHIFVCMIGNYKLNLHILEKCNHHCGFCFAHYHLNNFMNLDDSYKVIEKAAESKMFYEVNIAGGEPLMFPKIEKVIQHIKDCNMNVSIITNGSLLDEEMLDKFLHNLTTIGFSIHSFNERTNQALGCCTSDGKTLKLEKLIRVCDYIKKNSDCKIKLNTTVNSMNKNELMAPIIKRLPYSRYKILKCQEYENNKRFCVSDQEFENFCKINGNLPNAVIEKDMHSTYIMVNPAGDLIQNHPTKPEYTTLGSALNDNFLELLKKLPLNEELYRTRYN